MLEFGEVGVTFDHTAAEYTLVHRIIPAWKADRIAHNQVVVRHACVCGAINSNSDPVIGT